jgi:ubiquinol-cytochrome c reductase cytochrome c subunit
MTQAGRAWTFAGAAGATTLSLALFVSGGSSAQETHPPRASTIAAVYQTDETAEGQQLFEASCSTCHGVDGQGTANGPSLEGVGEASADFQLRTGRMPLSNDTDQSVRKDPAFDDDQIEALVEYVGTLGEGPPIPEVDLEGASLVAGQELFIENCAACHGATGAGGAVGNQALAPGLSVASEVEIAEAVIVGPGEMPQFDFTDEQRNDLINFVNYLRDERRPGGADIGGIGPVPEGFVAWLVGLGSLIVICLFIGSRRDTEDDVEEAA